MFIKLKDIPEPCVEYMKNRHIFLTEDTKRGWRNKEGAPTNLLIEGENYHALRMLEYTHAGKIDFIYDDSPYNTGNRDFAYQDDFTADVPDDEEGNADTGGLTYVNAEDPSRHSKWVSFIERRLRIKWALLSDCGVIALSIDDNEMAHLKLLCDTVFGELNFVANMVWKKKATNGGMAKGGFGVNIQHEYVLVYAKDKSQIVINGIPGGEELDAKYKFEDMGGRYRLVDFAGYGLTYQPSLDYEILTPEGKAIKANDVMGVGYKAGWRWGKGKFEKSKDQIVWVKGKPKTKTYMNGDCQLIHPSSLLDDKELLANTDDTHKLVPELEKFPYRKPVALIKRLSAIFSHKDSIILDCFAGSGTTGQAVQELNREDGGTRQFILCTNNEKSEELPNGIARGVTYPRLQKTIANDTNLVYMRVSMLKHANTSNTCEKVAQLELKNRMLALLKVKYGVYETIEQTEKYVILKGDRDYHLGVYFNHTDKQSHFGAVQGSFKKHVDAYSENNDVVFNTPDNGYATGYFRFIQTTNPK